MVFHDFDLDRLTEGTGPVAGRTVSELQRLAYRIGGDRIPTLAEFLDLIAGRVPLICEIKSRFDGDMRLVRRVAEIAAGRPDARLALKSFDPEIIRYIREEHASRGLGHVPLGIVAEARYDDEDWDFLSAERKFALANLLHFPETRPDFLSWWVRDLPHACPLLCRSGIGMPVMTWTVRTPEQVKTARQWADQIVFEGFAPA